MSVRRDAARGRSRDYRGAVGVETALVAMPLMLIMIGILEFSFAYRDYVVVTSAARSAARIASTGPDAGACTPDSDDDATPCPAGQVPQFAQNAANAIARSVKGIDVDAIQRVVVYKANAKGFPGTLDSMPSSCAGIANCVTYTWRPTQNAGLGRFRYTSGSWNPKIVSACFPGTATAPLDSVGVQVVAERGFLTGLFGASVTLADSAVLNFEPLPAGTCGSGQHA